MGFREEDLDRSERRTRARIICFSFIGRSRVNLSSVPKKMKAYFCPAPVEGLSLGLPAAPRLSKARCVRKSYDGSGAGKRERKKI